jgi:nanoRNase/pAp phosphatase (c-di-AMP/oligoRNAs hydrolase)
MNDAIPGQRAPTQPQKKEKTTRRNGSILRQPRLAGPHAVTARFAPLLGKRFARDPENLLLLKLAHAAYIGLSRAAARIRGRGANIFTQWLGDPDALGSAVVLRAILEQLGVGEIRILMGALGHPQNRNLVQRCGITFHDPNKDRIARGLNCLVDTSPPLGMTNTGLVRPVSRYFFIADHHTEPDEVEANCRAQGVKRVSNAFVGLPVGSTSAFLAVLGAAFGVLERLGPRGRAAVALGIYTDTSALLHGPTPLDFRMFEILTRDEATQDLLDELRDYRVPSAWFLYRSAAFQHMETRGAIRIAPVGFVSEALRDVIAEVASDLLRIEGTSIGIAIALTDRGTEVSVRADSRLIGGDQQRIVRVIDSLLEYAFPGVSGFKFERQPPHRVEGGAFVAHDKTRQMMLQPGTVEGTDSSDRAVEHCRACARALVAALEDLRFARPEEIQGLL